MTDLDPTEIDRELQALGFPLVPEGHGVLVEQPGMIGYFDCVTTAQQAFLISILYNGTTGVYATTVPLDQLETARKIAAEIRPSMYHLDMRHHNDGAPTF